MRPKVTAFGRLRVLEISMNIEVSYLRDIFSTNVQSSNTWIGFFLNNRINSEVIMCNSLFQLFDQRFLHLIDVGKEFGQILASLSTIEQQRIFVIFGDLRRSILQEFFTTTGLSSLEYSTHFKL